jgi:hypothetical protein
MMEKERKEKSKKESRGKKKYKKLILTRHKKLTDLTCLRTEEG